MLCKSGDKNPFNEQKFRNLYQQVDAHEVNEADSCQVKDEGVERHWDGVQCDRSGIG